MDGGCLAVARAWGRRVGEARRHSYLNCVCILLKDTYFDGKERGRYER